MFQQLPVLKVILQSNIHFFNEVLSLFLTGAAISAAASLGAVFLLFSSATVITIVVKWRKKQGPACVSNVHIFLIQYRFYNRSQEESANEAERCI